MEIYWSRKGKGCFIWHLYKYTRYSRDAFKDAIREIVLEEKITTAQVVKDIDPVTFLLKAKALNPSEIHQGRIQDAIDEEN